MNSTKRRYKVTVYLKPGTVVRPTITLLGEEAASASEATAGREKYIVATVAARMYSPEEYPMAVVDVGSVETIQT